VRILGLDPGTAATGFGIVAFADGRLTLELCGVWRPPAGLELPRRLDFLASALQEVVEPGEDALVMATVVSMLRAGRIRKVIRGRSYWALSSC